MSHIEPVLQHFDYEHLPKHLADVSEPFCLLALDIVATLPSNGQRSIALQKLLEAKDAAVRAMLEREDATGAGR